MRKNQTLIIAVVLLLCSAVSVQAQRGIYQVIGIGANAREGGAAETAGNVVMFLSNGSTGGGVVTVRYSAPLAKGTTPMLALDDTASDLGVSVDLDDDAYTVTLNLTAHDGRHNGGRLHTFRRSARPARSGCTYHGNGFG